MLADLQILIFCNVIGIRPSRLSIFILSSYLHEQFFNLAKVSAEEYKFPAQQQALTLYAIKTNVLIIQVYTDQEIKIQSGDANDFITILNKIIFRLVDKFQTKEMCYIRIRNWFDHKWLNYSGKSIVQFHGGAGLFDSSLNNEWREKITVPPF